MIDINTALANILKAIYGKDVRQSIHDAIYQINEVSIDAKDLAQIRFGTAVTSPTSPIDDPTPTDPTKKYSEGTIYLNTTTGIMWRLEGGSWTDKGHLKTIDSITGPVVDTTDTSGLTDKYTITYNDGTTTTYLVKNGAKGESIKDIIKLAPGTDPLVDEYEIELSDGSKVPTHFTVTNGKDAFVPTAKVSRDSTNKKTVIEITDSTGTTTENIDDPVSPTAKVTRDITNTKTVIEITDVNGTTTESISDPISPTASVVKNPTTKETTVTVTDTNGTTTAVINDGNSIVDIVADGSPVGNVQQYKTQMADGSFLPTKFSVTNGVSSYLWIRYSSKFDGSDMVVTPSANTPFIGIVVTSQNSAPTDPSVYSWVRFLGQNGTGTGDMIKSDYVTIFPATNVIDYAAGLWDGSNPILASQLMAKATYDTNSIAGAVDKAVQLVDATNSKIADSELLANFSDDGTTGLKYKGAEIGGKVDVDDTTIKYNSNNKLEAQIDDDFSATSELPLQNKKITNKLGVTPIPSGLGNTITDAIDTLNTHIDNKTGIDDSTIKRTTGATPQLYVPIDNDTIYVDNGVLKSKGGGGGIKLSEPTNVSLEAGDEYVKIKWTDPDDVEYQGAKLAEWSKTVIVRSTTGYPSSVTDGTIIYTETTRNSYNTYPFTDSGLTNETTYYYGIFPCTTDGVYTTTSRNSAKPQEKLPQPVSDLALTGTKVGSNASIKATWTLPSDATKCVAYLSTNPNVSDTVYDSASTEITSTNGEYTFTGLALDTTYYVVVYSINAKNRKAKGSTLSKLVNDIPDGKTVTPTDDVQTWIACAGRTEAYTTISQVLADTTLLYVLMGNNNACDYLVRSTTWASSICANENAMTYIGDNNYCADTLLADSTWCTEICNQTNTASDGKYLFEKVLNTKVPTLSSNNGSDGGIASSISTSEHAYRSEAYYAFDGLDYPIVRLVGLSSNYVQYSFAKDIKVKKIGFKNSNDTQYTAESKFDLKGIKSDGTETLIAHIEVGTPYDAHKLINVQNNEKYRTYRIVPTAPNNTYSGTDSGNRFLIETLQFYGRG